ncbi:MAG: efflux RND transporter periplasmic adaptor subunit [Gammaproteobacteria bacterium]|nr:efflux RND transporter periplasmic adaptor subunit [Gammaproteobacteria bacterium]
MIISKKCWLILFIALPGIISCDNSDKNPEKDDDSSLHLVETIVVKSKPVSHEQVLSGTLETVTSVRLHNEEAGKITLLPYHEGDTVAKDALLVELDGDIIKAELDKAAATRQQAEIDYKRLKKLQPQKLASEDEVARSLTELNIARAEQQLQQLRMDRTQIRAPFDGIVSQRNYEPGDAVSARSHILSLIQPDGLLVKVKVSAQWLTLIKKGDAMQLTIDALGDELFDCRVERIHPEIDAASRKGVVELTLTPTPKQARAGQLARVNFKSEITDRLVIPSHAIHHDTNGPYAYIIETNNDNKTVAMKHYLVKGLQFGEWTEILSGIKLDDRLIIKGFLGLRDDKVVAIVSHASKDKSPVNTIESNP